MINDEEFNKYYEQYKKLLNKISYPYSKSLDRDDIKSAQLEILWQTIKYFDPKKSKFSTYLYTSLTRKLNYLCSLKKKINTVSFKNKEYIDYPPADEIFEYLPEDLRTLMHQIYIDGYSYKELSKIYNVTSQTLRNKVQQAKLILKNKINGV